MRQTNHLITAALSMLLLFSSITLLAHGPKYTHIATTAYIAEDPGHEWTVAEVAVGKYDSLFNPITENVANLNFTTSTWWVKFALSNGTDISHEYYIETARPLTNVVNLYRVTRGMSELLYAAGDEVPFDDRPVIYRKFVFPLTLRSDEDAKLVLQLRSDGEVITLPIKLWEKDNFNGFIQRENLTLGIYYGLLIFVAGLFLFFAIVVKERIYSYYVSFVVFLFFMQASIDGLAFEYIWPSFPWIANHSILFFSGASVFMLMLYAADFLDIHGMPKWYRSIYRTLLIVVGLCVITGLTSGTIYELTYPVVNGMSLISLLVIILGIGWNQRVKGDVNVFFALGFLSVLAGGIVFILTNFNLIYSDFLSQNAIKLGSAAEVTFLSLAMVSRYRDIQKEKEVAQKESFDSLEELNRITRDQNIMLEQQVAERTTDLKEKSDELEEKNKEIIDSITYAKRIQEAILPPDLLFAEQVPNSFVLFLPKDIVAGDFYWLEQVDDLVLFAAADCTGHGVPGAMVSVVCHGALNRSVREFQLRDPGEILDRTALIVDETFEKSEQEVKDGMDIALCAYNTKTKELHWAGANNPLWIISNDLPEMLSGGELTSDPSLSEAGPQLYEVKADKQPIGRYPNRSLYTTHKIQLNEGDAFYVFSDGYPDQFGGPKNKKYKSKNLKRFLLSIQTHPTPEQHDLLHNEFHSWRGKNEQVDDVCVIGVRV
ncbi:MAG: SpoIIE family protein phosphatase [Flavobacteriales bacterium]|nr:SpoIIE family protein phosphatase [Flavobacteriales bacterium]